MPSIIKLVVEGKADKKFLQDLASSIGNNLSEDNFIVTGGFSPTWIQNHYPSVMTAIAEGLRPVLIVDANSDFNHRRADLDAQLAAANLTGTPYFILPNNHHNEKKG